MSEVKWTKTPPTEPGWYWVRWDRDPVVAEVAHIWTGLSARVQGEWLALEQVPSWGPRIVPPIYTEGL